MSEIETLNNSEKRCLGNVKRIGESYDFDILLLYYEEFITASTSGQPYTEQILCQTLYVISISTGQRLNFFTLIIGGVESVS